MAESVRDDPRLKNAYEHSNEEGREALEFLIKTVDDLRVENKRLTEALDRSAAWSLINENRISRLRNDIVARDALLATAKKVCDVILLRNTDSNIRVQRWHPYGGVPRDRELDDLRVMLEQFQIAIVQSDERQINEPARDTNEPTRDTNEQPTRDIE